jgi:cob(I)alamin adenosyltransferase
MARKRIYTKTGDDGTTGLLYGGRVPKDSTLPTAYGAVDEAQAVLGLARVHSPAGELSDLLITLERDLWVLMAELATQPENRAKLEPGATAVAPEMVERLESVIDDIDARFEHPTDFVVPGETVVASWLDLARTVVRRAEREALAAAPAPSLVGPYLNRLSDLLWTLARWHEGEPRTSRSVSSPEKESS